MKLDEFLSDSDLRISAVERVLWNEWKVIYLVLNAKKDQLIKIDLNYFVPILRGWTKRYYLFKGTLTFYHHFLEQHLVEVIVMLQKLGLCLAEISGQGCENSNLLAYLYEERGGSNNGGYTKKKTELQLIERQNRALTYTAEKLHLLYEVKHIDPSENIIDNENEISILSFGNKLKIKTPFVYKQQYATYTLKKARAYYLIEIMNRPHLRARVI
ncbi:MAG: hypothetical protein ACK4IX_06120, partial [Candidatus Sericytochromatia bacterium]